MYPLTSARRWTGAAPDDKILMLKLRENSTGFRKKAGIMPKEEVLQRSLEIDGQGVALNAFRSLIVCRLDLNRVGPFIFLTDFPAEEPRILVDPHPFRAQLDGKRNGILIGITGFYLIGVDVSLRRDRGR